jgi:F-type H+-transporting ATPase subunit b
MRCAWIAVLVVVLGLGSSQGWAAKDHADAATGAAGEAAPKTNPLKPSAELGIWTLIVFVLLLLVLSKVAWKPMLEGLQKRESNIHIAFEEAAKARSEVKELRDHLAAERAKIAEEVRQALDEARRDGQRLVEEMQSKSRQEIQAERERLYRELAMARDQAVKDLWDRTAEIAAAISTTAIRKHISQDDHRRLIDEALAELGQAGREWQQQASGVRV